VQQCDDDIHTRLLVRKNEREPFRCFMDEAGNIGVTVTRLCHGTNATERLAQLVAEMVMQTLGGEDVRLEFRLDNRDSDRGPCDRVATWSGCSVRDRVTKRFLEWATAAGVKDTKAAARALVVLFAGAVAGSEMDGPQRSSEARWMGKKLLAG
jgi:hypothetical protein